MGDKYLGHNLIFLISQPRAGSTMLQRILASSPSVLTSAEPWVMLHPLYALKKTGFQAEYDSNLAYIALNDFLTHYADEEDTYFDAIRCFAKSLYSSALQKGKNEKFFLDKTPRYYFIIHELYRLFPEANFIFLIRNPLAVLYSILKTWIPNDNLPRIAYYKNDLLIAPIRILEGIDNIGIKAKVIHYEDILTSPYESINSICQSIGISFQVNMLDYGQHKAFRGTFGDNTGVTNYSKPSIDNLNKWMHLCDNKQTSHFAISYLESLGIEIVKRLGYDYMELKEKVDLYKSYDSKSIIPWNIAIRNSSNRTIRDNLLIEKAILLQNNSILLGYFLYIRKNYRRIFNSFLLH